MFGFNISGNYSGGCCSKKPVWLGANCGWNDAVCVLLGVNYALNEAVCAPRRVGCSKIVIKICSKKYLFLVLLGC